MVLFIFTGCDKEVNDLPAKSLPVVNSQELPTPADAQALTLITSRTGLYNHAYASNENGCYFTVANEDGSANIMYIDYQTLRVVYLSSDIQSTHNSEIDSSWIKNAIGGSTLIMLKNKIGIITFGMPSKNNYSSENAARIFTADLDGANRELLYEFMPNEEIKSAIAFDGDCIYFLIKKYDNTASNQLVSINITTKNKNVIATYPDDADYSIIGTNERNIICKAVGIPAKYANSPPNELAKYICSKLLLVNVDNGTEENLFEWNGTMFSEIVGENIYLYNSLDKTINQITFKPSQSVERLFPTLIEGEGQDFILVGEIIDEHFFLLNKNNNNLVFINPDTKQAFPFDFKNNDYNISVVASTANDYLVITENASIAVTSYAPDDTPIQSNAIYPRFALINKDDYWNMQKNFREIIYK